MRPRGRLLSQAAMRPVPGLVIFTMAILIALPIRQYAPGSGRSHYGAGNGTAPVFLLEIGG